MSHIKPIRLKELKPPPKPPFRLAMKNILRDLKKVKKELEKIQEW